ncbi:MAG: hypothetical protein JXR40_03580 [Pontiellaceae bacterium]|nr:hypothetical protein [Pontiellaceae bacterium]
MSNSTKYCVTAILCALILSGGYVLVNHDKDDRCARGDLSVEKSPLQDQSVQQDRGAEKIQMNDLSQEDLERMGKELAALQQLRDALEATSSALRSMSRPLTNTVRTIKTVETAKMPEISIPDISGTGEQISY